MQAPPDPHVALVLGLILAALTLFATERIRLESAALLVLVSLLVTFSALPYATDDGERFDPVSLFEAFGNEALVAVSALMVLGKGIENTRALQPLVAVVSRHWAENPQWVMLAVMIVAALLSAFMNNTPIVVMLLPALIAIANKNRLSPSRLLLPVAFATIIGGMTTTIGTSTNLLVATLAREIAGVEFAMFDFAALALVAGAAGILYLWLVAPRITPDRRTGSGESVSHRFVAVLRIREASNLAGATIADCLRACGHSLDVDHVERADGSLTSPLPTVRLGAGDYLYVRGDRDALKEAENVMQAPLTDLQSAAHEDPDRDPRLAEILVTGDSELNGRSLAAVDFHSRYGVTAVALHRARPERRNVYRPPEAVTLEAGDILLCQGTEEQLDAVTEDMRLLLLRPSAELPMTQRSLAALGIVALVVLVAATGLLPIAISALAGVAAMLAYRCLSWRHVADALSTRVVLVIVVSLALGRALVVTGGDDYLASQFNTVLADLSPLAVVSVLMLFAGILTNVVTNNAAALITTPVAVEIAAQLGMDPEPVVLAVLFGANLCFITPIGYQDNLLVYSAGGYRFGDFMRVGVPLVLILWALLTWQLAVRYGLSGA